MHISIEYSFTLSTWWVSFFVGVTSVLFINIKSQQRSNIPFFFRPDLFSFGLLSLVALFCCIMEDSASSIMFHWQWSGYRTFVLDKNWANPLYLKLASLMYIVVGWKFCYGFDYDSVICCAPSFVSIYLFNVKHFLLCTNVKICMRNETYCIFP